MVMATAMMDLMRLGVSVQSKLTYFSEHRVMAHPKKTNVPICIVLLVSDVITHN